jgi:hypothetical protein
MRDQSVNPVVKTTPSDRNGRREGVVQKRGIHRNAKMGFIPVQKKTTRRALRLNDGKGRTKITN